MSKAITLSKLGSGIAVITIDLPDSKMNLLSGSVMTELNEALDTIERDGSKGVIIVSGKEGNFGAGANVEEIQALQSQPAIKIYEAAKDGKRLFARLEKLNSIAAINGTCLGGFTELTLGCKYRIATSDPKTEIGVPEVLLGFIPGWGGTVRLPLLIGAQAAFKMISTGKAESGYKAWRLGLVDEIVAKHELVERAAEILLGSKPKRYQPRFKEGIVRKLTAVGLEGNSFGRSLFRKMASQAVYAATKGKYPAPVEALKVVMVALSGDREKAFEAESQAFAKLATSQVSKNLVSIFFGQSVSKKMEGVAPNIDVKSVGVLGAGVMGAGIAQAAAYKGYTVVLKDIDQGALDKGMETIRGLFKALVDRKKLSQTEMDVMMSAVKPTLDYADLADCDLVIEAVVEKMNVKKMVRAECEKAISKPFIFATNTSSLSVGGMTEELRKGEELVAPASRHPEMTVGIHFFNPVHKMQLVEVVRGSTTSDETLAAAKAFAAKLGKFPVLTNDAPGFVVNRILTPYMREAMVLAEAGVPIPDIEKAALNFGMLMGPFTLLDEVGLDIAGHVIETLHGAFGDRLSPPPILSVVKEKKLLGRKGGKGIYLYDEKNDRRFVMEGGRFSKKKKRYLLNPEITDAIKAPVNRKTEGEIQDRLFLAMVAEAALAVQENVIEDPAQLDFAMIYGTGFPPFIGGPLAYADAMGTSLAYQKLLYLSKVHGDNYKPCDLLKEKGATGKPFRG
jgi:3-hydroxyacyl-CoA dehydrogenase/enoyl-CoA hydratase/3-hydroxybutyryl-CoA epimerase